MSTIVSHWLEDVLGTVSKTYKGMLRFIARFQEVQVMRNIMVLVLSCEDNLHVKLTPSLLLDSERGIPDR